MIEEIKDKLDDIRIFIQYDLNPSYTGKRIWRRLKTVAYWMKLGWTDQPWDSDFLLEVIDRKLKDMELYFRSGNTQTMSSEKTAREITQARYLLSVMRDTYAHNQEYFDRHEAKWGNGVSRVRTHSVSPDDGKELMEWLGIHYPKAKNVQEQEQADKEMSRIFDKCSKDSEEYTRRFFDYLIEHYEDWWD